PRPPGRGSRPATGPPAAASFFPPPSGRAVGRAGVARSGNLEGEPEVHKPPPPGLRADGHAPPVGDVHGDLRPGPPPAVRGATLEGREQGRPLVRGQPGSPAVRRPP